MKKLTFVLMTLASLTLATAQNSDHSENSKKEIQKKVIIIKGDNLDVDSLLKAEDLETELINDMEMNMEHEKMVSVEMQPGNKAVLGIQAEDAGGNNGASITQVMDGSGAEKAGLEEGDIILKINNNRVADFDELISRLSGFRPGDKVKVKLLRGGQEISKTVTLGKPSAELARPSCCAGKSCKNVEKKIIIRKDKNGSQGMIEIPEGDSDRKVIIRENRINREEQSNRNLNVSVLVGSPNPNKGQLNISFEGDKAPFTIKVVDLNGKEIYSEKVDNDSGQYSKQIELDKAKGTLLIQVLQSGKTSTAKIIME
ncbi:MAG: PDZ domain-containing protein [Saprospiraceae bacterium]